MVTTRLELEQPRPLNTLAANRYVLCLPNTQPLDWKDRPYPPDSPFRAFAYYDGAFQAIERELGPVGLTFYVTFDVNVLPSYGNSVVAIVLGDEWASPPAYSRRVLLTFKQYGSTVAIFRGLIGRSASYRVAVLAQLLRNLLKRAPLHLDRLLKGGRPIVPIPLGYYNQLPLDILPMLERSIDVGFAGSIEHETYARYSLKRLFGTPKIMSRRSMLSAVDRFRREAPQYSYEMGITPSFQSVTSSDADRYSRRLMETKICLCPRGTSLETFRVFEALRYGCVVVAEPLPEHWFYRGAPIVYVNSWERDLGSVLADLLRDVNRLDKMHHSGVEWWNSVCSENALGAFMTSILKRVQS